METEFLELITLAITEADKQYLKEAEKELKYGSLQSANPIIAERRKRLLDAVTPIVEAKIDSMFAEIYENE